MFIELTEYLRCPEFHEETYLVLVPETMVGRDVLRGTLGCPVCRRQYVIVKGVVEFGGDGWRDSVPEPAARDVTLPDPHAVQALLGLGSPGGYLVLVGSATRLVEQLAELIGGVHFVGVNPPPDVEASHMLSPLRSDRMIPMRTGVTRGAVLGTEHVHPPWLAEGVRVLLRGQRLVMLCEWDYVSGTERLAVGEGLWVGTKQQ